MNVIMKTLAICLLVQLATNIVQAKVDFESLIIAKSYLQTSLLANVTSERYVVAMLTTQASKWRLVEQDQSLRIIADTGDEPLFAGPNVTENRREVYTWTSGDFKITEPSGLWKIEHGSGEIIYIRNVKYNEYLCTDKDAPEVGGGPIVYTASLEQKDHCGQWKTHST